MKRAALAGLLAIVLAKPATAQAPEPPVALTICRVFGAQHCYDALRVFWCESRWKTWARNGQYLGIAQMGTWERRTYGHGDTALEQTRAAYRYWRVAGWQPWTCRSAI